jgi:parallel beta-helix repeat protein
MKLRLSRRGAGALVATAVTVALVGAASPANAASRQVITVHPGDSIQAAIDAASPGAKVKIRAGTYHENVYVGKDAIELEGDGVHDTLLLPPDTATPNPCVGDDGTIFGAVCVGFVAGDPVDDFELEDMTIQGFANGAFLVNTSDAEIERMVFADNEEYGMFYNDSTGGEIHDNVAYGSHEAGLYIGDSPNADVDVEDNEAYDNGNGILLRDASNGEAERNDLHDNCIGILLINTGAPSDADDWEIEHNRVVDNTHACPGDEEEGIPPTSGLGIGVGGGSDNEVEHNDVSGNAPSGPSGIGSGGIALFSTAGFGGSPASNNEIEHNDLDDNEPFDLSDDGAGTDNSFRHNDCNTSQPDGLCDR